MINYKELLFKTLTYIELPESKKNGCVLQIPQTACGTPLSVEEFSNLEKKYKISFHNTLKEFYKQLEYVKIYWKLFDKEGDTRVTTDQFKNDLWLKEHYLDKTENPEATWLSLKDSLAGYLFISSAEELLKQNPNNSYYVTLEAMGLDPKEYYLFDAQERGTAILKREEGVIQDNIWIIDLMAKELIDMKIGVEKYIELAYKAKLFQGWQLVYLWRGKRRTESKEYQFMVRFLPKLVPHLQIDFKAFGIDISN
jgi:hypothetical protein